MDETALRQLPAVAAALAEAHDQARRYRTALLRQRGERNRPRCYAFVAVGLERIVADEVVVEDAE